MAKIGMRWPIVAKIKDYTEGQAIEYEKGVFMGKAISASLTWDKSESKLYADDALAESDEVITGGSLTIGVDQVSYDGRTVALGQSVEIKEDGLGKYKVTGTAAPYVGVGFVSETRISGKTAYRAEWIHRVQFSLQGESLQTRGENINWQTEKLDGNILAAMTDTDVTNDFIDVEDMETAAAALEWLKAKAGGME